MPYLGFGDYFRNMGIIALLSDFGLRDPYAAELKGALLGRNPHLVLTDITHEVEPYNVKAAGFILWQACRTFPRATVFIAIVDPGAGTSRKLLAVKTDRHFFLGPDNGVLQYILTYEKVKEVREISPKPSREVKADLYGRESLAAAAALLSRANQFKNIGPLARPAKLAPLHSVRLTSHKIIADIIYRDHFGNCVLNVSNAQFKEWMGGSKVRAFVRKKTIPGVYDNFAAIPKGRLGLVWGSTGFIEIAGHCCSAAETFKLREGNTVELRRTRSGR